MTVKSSYSADGKSFCAVQQSLIDYITETRLEIKTMQSFNFDFDNSCPKKTEMNDIVTRTIIRLCTALQLRIANKIENLKSSFSFTIIALHFISSNFIPLSFS